MDQLPETELQERLFNESGFELKYKARYQQGDIIEIQPDGYWLDREFNRNAFVVIKVVGLEMNNKYVEAFGSETEPRRRKWRVAKEELPLPVLQQLKDTGIYETTKAVAANYLRDKGLI